MSIFINEKEFNISKVQQGKFEQWGVTFQLDCIYEVINEFESNNLRGINLSVTKKGEYFLEGWKAPDENVLTAEEQYTTRAIAWLFWMMIIILYSRICGFVKRPAVYICCRFIKRNSKFQNPILNFMLD
ncbi:hypothetical protein [Ruminiclostridium josui]|uniref:hypothetical protein n=1 Tax=Ruminiclostridium josui TaxID=1499 RepID=UPI0006D092C9|nr:hypothetical protein [Ruminiclostridium josui]